MTGFREITAADASLFREKLGGTPSPQLIGCFEAFYLWREVLRLEYALLDGVLVVRAWDGEVPRYFFPFGQGDAVAVVRSLAARSEAEGVPFLLTKVPEGAKERLERELSGLFLFRNVRDHAEYIYETEKFVTYRGTALQPKRNFVNYAKKNYAWKYENIEPENRKECLAFAEMFDGNESFEADNEALKTALREFGRLRLDGGLLRVDGRISALFVCAPSEDGQTAAGLFLRGDHRMKGLIPLLYQEFFSVHPAYRYVNLAEDLGIEGLRKNKLSYQPFRLLELYEGVRNPDRF